MADIVKQILAKPIQYADEVIKLADQASFMKAECGEIKVRTEKLAGLLRQAARASGDLYERPTRRIIDDTEQVQQQLDNSIGDVSWLLRVSAPADDRDDEYLGLPPIAANDRDDPESVEHIVNAGVCQVVAKILKEGHMKVQIVVAWALSELAANHRKCQDPFAQHNVIRLLVSHLAFETIPEHSKYAIASKHSMSSIHSIVMANSTPKSSDEGEEKHTSVTNHPMDNQMPSQMHNIVTNTLAMKSTMLPNKGAAGSPSHSDAGEKSGKVSKQQNQFINHHHKHKMVLVVRKKSGRWTPNPTATWRRVSAAVRAAAVAAAASSCVGRGKRGDGGEY
ncbi:uncharacterized protein LOC131023187 [Salvia miltiorrhiza]|uniref:uncharacterized protein LOC131023187 n=1 Tax=Salvia miltiorrhiza TaxID=226208 RepID=UPI0025AC58BB|nr:uncharacterized protein LOC131023187 [Salvia miltiorrhiza]